jgi:hypothetical protein
MKYLFLILISLQFNCLKETIREFKPVVSLKNKNLKIGTVGFYPYMVTASTITGRRRSTTVGLNYDKSLKDEFKIGKELSSFQKPGINPKIGSDKVTDFVKLYLSSTGKSGIEEILKYIEIKEDSKKETSYKLKNFDVDYIVVGIMNPSFKKLTAKGQGMILSFFPAAMTLGIFPFFQEYSVEPDFYLYDKNLNLVNNFKIMSYYSTTHAIWNSAKDVPKESDERTGGSAGSTNQSKVYIPEIHQASDDFAIFLNKL